MLEKSHYSEEQPEIVGICRHCNCYLRRIDGVIRGGVICAPGEIHELERRTQAGRFSRSIVDDFLKGVRE